MSLVRDGAEYSAEEVPDCKQRQIELSRQMTRLIDVLYALVLRQGLESPCSCWFSNRLNRQ